MAKKYGVKGYLGDILRGMAGTTPLYEAQAAGMPEAAGTSPEVFRALMGERKMKPGMEIREMEVDIRERALGLQKERDKLAKERLRADIDYRKQMIGIRKQGLGIQIKQAANNPNDPNLRAFTALTQGAVKLLNIPEEDRTENDNQLLGSWITEMQERGIDIGYEEIAADPGYWSQLWESIKGVPRKAQPQQPAKQQPQPATVPKSGKKTPSGHEDINPLGIKMQ